MAISGATRMFPQWRTRRRTCLHSLVLVALLLNGVGAQFRGDVATTTPRLLIQPNNHSGLVPYVDNGLGRRRRVPPTIAPTVAPTQNAAATAIRIPQLDCAAKDRCCEARQAWLEVEAFGGCGGSGVHGSSVSRDKCRLAASLCQECHLEGEVDAPWMNVSVSTGGGNPQRSSSTARLYCAPLAPARTCSMAAGDIGMVIVTLTGVLLLILSGSWTVLFDTHGLPVLLNRGERSWSGRSCSSPKSLSCTGLAPQPPPLCPVERAPGPTGEPPVGNSALSKLRSAASPDVNKMMSWLPVDAELGGGSRCSTATYSDNSGATNSTMDTTPPQSERGITKNVSNGSPTSPECSLMGVPTGSTLRPGTPGSRNGKVSWPARLARIWAYRSVFLWVSHLAVCLRVVHTVATTLTLRRTILVSIVEIAICVIPLFWCQWTSRPPSTPESALRASIAHGFPCNKFPRFIAFALTTVVLETYCTVKAASAVQETSCETAPWQTIALHCFGVVVAVVRVYAALLGLRLQDEFASAARRVMPMPQTLSLDSIGFDFDLETSDQTAGKEIPITRWRSHSPVGGAAPYLPGNYGHLEDAQTVAQPQRSRCCSRRSDKSTKSNKTETRLQKYCSRRYVLRAALVLVVVAATASAIIFHTTNKKQPPKPLPSSCATAQNATATCSQFESIGDKIWDPRKGQSVAGAADTQEDCCMGCDELDGCQAWMFEAFSKRCRMIRFEATPCKEEPGDLECRCYTHAGTAFGFKPTSQIVWLQGP